MTRAGAGIGILCVLALVGVSCISRPPHPLIGAPNQPIISLHGFFSNGAFLRLTRKLLDKGQGSPLPGDWITTIPLEDYKDPHKPMYVDKDRGGKDDDRQKGLEGSTFAFYGGDGHDIDGWFVPNLVTFEDDVVPIDSVRVGDLDLRYFWLYSCEVLAHGPKTVTNGLNYSAPQRFNPNLPDDADVFERWTGSFACGMRMVCGGSTVLGHRGVGEIWSYLLEAENSVADAWILGLANPKEVPVCLARGGRDQASSALEDRTLHTEKVAQGGWLHFQYPVKCDVSPTYGSALHVICSRQPVPGTDSEAKVSGASDEATSPLGSDAAGPAPLPKVETSSQSVPGGSTTTVSLPLGFVRLAGHNAWKYQRNSGAFVFAKSREVSNRYDLLASCDRETEWTVQPTELLAKAGLPPEVLLSDPLLDFSFTAYEMRVESRRDGAREGACAVHSLFLLRHSLIDVGTKSNPKRYPIFGPAAVFELQRKGGEDPVLVSFSAPRRRPTVVPGKPLKDRWTVLKKASVTLNEAYEELQLKAEEYPIENARATLGYEEAPLRCQQHFLRPTYQIQFFPTNVARSNRATVTVSRDARLNPSDEGWICKSWGNFPPP